MSDRDQALRALVEQWRDIAENFETYWPNDNSMFTDTLVACADELSALLTERPEGGDQPDIPAKNHEPSTGSATPGHPLADRVPRV